jgi:hypothetical protein
MMLFGQPTQHMSTQQKARWRQSFGSMIVEYQGPACAAWRQGSADLCEHDSCWDIMTEGATAYYRRVEALSAGR